MNVASVPEGWTAPVVQGVHHDVFPVSAEPVASPEEEKDCEAIY
jgi:hypothetical protein